MFHSESRPLIIRRLLLVVIVFLFAALQNTDGFLPVIFGARQFALIPLAVCVGMFEGEIPGLLYGMLSGCLWDVCASGTDGFHAFYLAFIGCLSGILIKFFLRQKLLSEYCICTASSVVYVLFNWFFNVYITVGDGGFKKLLGFFLPSAVVTSVFSFLVFYIIKSIHMGLMSSEEKTAALKR